MKVCVYVRRAWRRKLKETEIWSFLYQDRGGNVTNLQKFFRMSRVIWNLCFSTDRDFLSVFTSCNCDLIFLTLGGGGGLGFLISKVIRRLLNSFHAIFRRETSTALQRKSQMQISKHKKCLFVYLLSAEIFFCHGQRSNVFRFRFKLYCRMSREFVVCSAEVSLRIIRFRRPFWLPLWNFGLPRVNLRRLWRPGAR